MMTALQSTDPEKARLAFLLETVGLELEYLTGTDQRLFAEPFTPARAATLRADAALSERVDAFVARFGRLQDTLGDKLLPALLRLLGEPTSSVLDNLAKAERLGLLEVPAESWVAMRALRKRMIHEYIKDPAELCQALDQAHGYVPVLRAFTGKCMNQARGHGWV